VSAWLAFQRGRDLGLLSRREADDLCRQIHEHACLEVNWANSMPVEALAVFAREDDARHDIQWHAKLRQTLALALSGWSV
jgi:hypothetical protein